eukprot:TRINITY_DN19169_c0_g2_i1.p1 TRINITY_DN19169_c0_g2~~TRINITY_DN19169_c0_g2_i1.p1  ORF type:complete len:320 (-),score=79.42 TRINITY_DN19169_c0_g2_i1:125-1084(-)
MRQLLYRCTLLAACVLLPLASGAAATGTATSKSAAVLRREAAERHFHGGGDLPDGGDDEVPAPEGGLLMDLGEAVSVSTLHTEEEHDEESIAASMMRAGGGAISILPPTRRVFRGLARDGSDDFENFADNFKGNFGGAFSVAFKATFDSVDRNSPIIDFSNGPAVDNIVVARRNASNDLRFSVWRRERVNGQIEAAHRELDAKDVLSLKHPLPFLCVVDALGHMRIYTAGGRVVADRRDGFAPDQVPRLSLFVGRSSWPQHKNFRGSLEQLRVWNRVVSWKDAFPARAADQPAAAAAVADPVAAAQLVQRDRRRARKHS